MVAIKELSGYRSQYLPRGDSSVQNLSAEGDSYLCNETFHHGIFLTITSQRNYVRSCKNRQHLAIYDNYWANSTHRLCWLYSMQGTSPFREQFNLLRTAFDASVFFFPLAPSSFEDFCPKTELISCLVKVCILGHFILRSFLGCYDTKYERVTLMKKSLVLG